MNLKLFCREGDLFALAGSISAHVNDHSHLGVLPFDSGYWRRELAHFPTAVSRIAATHCVTVVCEYIGGDLVEEQVITPRPEIKAWPDEYAAMSTGASVNDLVRNIQVWTSFWLSQVRVQRSLVRINENAVMVGGKHLLAISSRLLVGYVAPANAHVDTGHEFLAVGSHSWELGFVNLVVRMLPYHCPTPSVNAGIVLAVCLGGKRDRATHDNIMKTWRRCLNFWLTSASQITMRGLDRDNSTRTLYYKTSFFKIFINLEKVQVTSSSYFYFYKYITQLRIFILTWVLQLKLSQKMWNAAQCRDQTWKKYHRQTKSCERWQKWCVLLNYW